MWYPAQSCAPDVTHAVTVYLPLCSVIGAVHFAIRGMYTVPGAQCGAGNYSNRWHQSSIRNRVPIFKSCSGESAAQPVEVPCPRARGRGMSVDTRTPAISVLQVERSKITATPDNVIHFIIARHFLLLFLLLLLFPLFQDIFKRWKRFCISAPSHHDYLAEFLTEFC